MDMIGEQYENLSSQAFVPPIAYAQHRTVPKLTQLLQAGKVSIYLMYL